MDTTTVLAWPQLQPTLWERLAPKIARFGVTLPELTTYIALDAEQCEQRFGVAISKGNLLICPEEMQREHLPKFSIAGGSGNLLFIGRNTTFAHCVVTIKGSFNTVMIGEDCRLRHASLYCQHRSAIILGRGVSTTSRSRFIAKNEPADILVGDDCMFASNTMVRTNDGHGIFDRATKQKINPAQDIAFCPHVWVADNATVLKGVVIGSHAVVAMGAIVTASVPRNCLVGGIPAKIIRRDILWSRHTGWHDEPEYESIADGMTHNDDALKDD